MAITFVGAATQEVEATGVDITLPNLLENDIVLIGGAEDTQTAPTAPNTAGYTELFQPSVSSNAPCCGLWWKRMGSTPDTVVNVDEFSAGTSATAFVIMCFRGVDTTTAVDATTTNANGATGDPDAPSITTVTNGAVVVAFGFIDDDEITSCSLSGYSNVNFQAANDGVGTRASAMAGWIEKATAGAEDPPAFVTDGDDQWHAASVALRPASGGGGGAKFAVLVTRS